MLKSAILSPCRQYRYTLMREWQETRPVIAFIGLNPSTADETTDDPTIRRCIAFAKEWGYGKLVMLNLFGLRSTNPKALYQSVDPIGGPNDAWLVAVSYNRDVVCAWGNHGDYLQRGQQVKLLLADRNLFHLGLNKSGQPKHPLYLPGNTTLRRFS